MTQKNTVGWADRPMIRQRIRYGLYAVCAVLLLAELVVHRHTVMPLEKLPAFYPLYGFLSLVVVVLLSKGLRRLIGRPEGYYNREEGSEPDDNRRGDDAT